MASLTKTDLKMPNITTKRESYFFRTTYAGMNDWMMSDKPSNVPPTIMDQNWKNHVSLD